MKRDEPAAPSKELVAQQLADWADEMGALEDRLAPIWRQYGPDEKRYKALTKLIADNAPASLASAIKIAGKTHVAVVHPNGFQTYILSMVDLFKRLTGCVFGPRRKSVVVSVESLELFLNSCGMTLEKCKELLPVEEQDLFMKKFQSGPRKVETYPLPSKVEEKAA